VSDFELLHRKGKRQVKGMMVGRIIPIPLPIIPLTYLASPLRAFASLQRHL
jgi:hypothetical protein